MEETVIDQIEDNVIEPVEDAAAAVEAEQAAHLEDVVDTPESTGETTEPEVVESAPDPGAIEAELPEAPESIAPDAEIAPDETPSAPAAQTEAEAPVGETEAPVVEQAASEPIVAADAIIAAAVERNAEADETVEPAEPEEPPVPVEILAFGFIDQNRKIHQNTTENYRGHVVGKAYDNPENQIAELEGSFAQFVKDADLIESDSETAKNKVGVLGRIRKLKATAGKADALGDFDALFARLRALEAKLVEEIESKKLSKESLIARAEEIKESTDWRVTGDAYKALFEEWKQVGATGKESDDSLWARFIGAREYFNQRRSQHFEQRQEQWGANAALKQELIVKAHELSTSDDWRATSEALRNLFAEWKKVGSAGRQQDEELWKQFREAQQHFYDRRAAFYEDNKSRKEALAARAKELSTSEDWESTFEEMKSMMADWRTVGTAGNRDLDNKLWDSFRGAQNSFFDRRFETQAKREQEAREAVRGKEQIVSAIEALGYTGDSVAAQEEAERLKSQYDALPSIRKDRQDQLDRRMRKALGDIKVNAAAEGARRAVTWEGKIREAVFKSKEQLDGLKASVAANQEALATARADLAVASGDEADILKDTISALEESIADNNAEIDRLEASIADIESSLR
ncbi:MAG TPA: DUF349 domain-containing protein [Thermomicrobiales bacterium]|nr:DUF349 domain-containing protein [Thermomicrobiales bacterium]